MPEFKSSDNLRLWYEDQGEGDGPPILCLSGLTRNSTDFEYVLPYLVGENRVIRLDYRGRGKSQRAPDWKTYTIPTEARDVLELMAHLGLEQVAILGTSRGGLIAMSLALLAKERLAGVCLVDIGPDLAQYGLDVILDYLGKTPDAQTYEAAVSVRADLMAGFEDVPEARWREEVEKHYRETPDGLALTYDAKLRDAVLDASAQPVPDLWPLFDAMAGLPLACIRGANSDLLTADTLAEMARRRPDMIVGEVPKRGHVPFLDEDEALEVLNEWTMLL
ncbi:MAG: alpha/beta hydrolase [Pseudomonadota bacterium]